MADFLVRVMTWNIHMGVGRDGRRDLERIGHRIRHFDADVVALQEVENLRPDDTEHDELAILSRTTGYRAVSGPTMLRGDGDYGNAVLTRWPVRQVRRHDISVAGREPRGILELELEVAGHSLRVIATHLGLRRGERRQQLERLLELIVEPEAGPLVLLGDFNVWTRRSLILRPFSRHFLRPPLPATFPAGWPLFPLDRIYLRGVREPRHWVLDDQVASAASDHRPLAAEFRLPGIAT